MAGGWDTSGGPIAQAHGGAGGFMGNLNIGAAEDGAAVDAKKWETQNKLLTDITGNVLKSQQMATQKAQSEKELAMTEQKMQLAAEDNQLQQIKYANSMKQQEIENQRQQKADARAELKSQLDLAEFSNKEEVGNILREKMPIIMDIVDNTPDADITKNKDYQTAVAAISAVDPKAGFNIINDNLVKQAKKSQDKASEATYNVASKIYAEAYPKAIEAIDKGKSIPEAMSEIRDQAAQLYKSGNIDQKALMEQLKHIADQLGSYSKNKDSVAKKPVLSYDKEGNTNKSFIIDSQGQRVDLTSADIKAGKVKGPDGRLIPFSPKAIRTEALNPNDIVTQIDATTGKKSNVAAKSTTDKNAALMKLLED